MSATKMIQIIAIWLLTIYEFYEVQLITLKQDSPIWLTSSQD